MSADAGTVVTGTPVDAVYTQLLLPSFPANELISLNELRAGVADGVTTVRIAGDPSDPTAVAVTDSLANSPAVLLSYFATRADRRGHGVGTSLLQGLLAGISADPAVSVVLAEVEHPGYHTSDDAHGDPVARLRFYARLGAHILDVPYFQPPVSAADDAVYGMLLLALHVNPVFVVGERLLPEAGLASALAAIMADADPARFPVAATLNAGRDPRGVRLLPPARLAEAPVALPL